MSVKKRSDKKILYEEKISTHTHTQKKRNKQAKEDEK